MALELRTNCYFVFIQDGRLLFTSPFSALLLYYQFQATKGAVSSNKMKLLDVIRNFL